MNEIISKLAKLIDVTSLVTLILTSGFMFLSITGGVTGQEFLTIFTIVIGFYFGTQYEKNR